jgi:hypothetical protein
MKCLRYAFINTIGIAHVHALTLNQLAIDEQPSSENGVVFQHIHDAFQGHSKQSLSYGTRKVQTGHSEIAEALAQLRTALQKEKEEVAEDTQRLKHLEENSSYVQADAIKSLIFSSVSRKANGVEKELKTLSDINLGSKDTLIGKFQIQDSHSQSLSFNDSATAKAMNFLQDSSTKGKGKKKGRAKVSYSSERSRDEETVERFETDCSSEGSKSVWTQGGGGCHSSIAQQGYIRGFRYALSRLITKILIGESITECDLSRHSIPLHHATNSGGSWMWSSMLVFQQTHNPTLDELYGMSGVGWIDSIVIPNTPRDLIGATMEYSLTGEWEESFFEDEKAFQTFVDEDLWKRGGKEPPPGLPPKEVADHWQDCCDMDPPPLPNFPPDGGWGPPPDGYPPGSWPPPGTAPAEGGWPKKPASRLRAPSRSRMAS